jgi:hypothetical protein
MPVEFKVRFFLLLLCHWGQFITTIPSEYITSFMKTFTEQLNREKDLTEKIDAFILNWNKIAKTFPDAILPQTYHIEKLIQIWADYHSLELQLEEIKV